MMSCVIVPMDYFQHLICELSTSYHVSFMELVPSISGIRQPLWKLC